ncbi:MAG: hypothetical protein COY58_00275 [Gammaproteobacteria bacterium CG_4_10_14_0_8_um_filter_38_16]|nr:MAG: hypothetical protein COY58_00275 [Gammaproteobacteria bacterium CG_4_10_14_0_8_um_filter_38_16]PJA02769.1 MAG: hypothetical protein COX72_08240 [Gammaproteobacteria bacterium CG_4_10_14_0_2_um_filter_38_22]PJB10740.1 MAG: hypothetical protein CO120_03475 [Gammaproteobacteria bacterium CG_4_9_14_3_um_filter_38_9]
MSRRLRDVKGSFALNSSDDITALRKEIEYVKKIIAHYESIISQNENRLSEIETRDGTQNQSVRILKVILANDKALLESHKSYLNRMLSLNDSSAKKFTVTNTRMLVTGMRNSMALTPRSDINMNKQREMIAQHHALIKNTRKEKNHSVIMAKMECNGYKQKIIFLKMLVLESYRRTLALHQNTSRTEIKAFFQSILSDIETLSDLSKHIKPKTQQTNQLEKKEPVNLFYSRAKHIQKEISELCLFSENVPFF